MVKVYMGSKIIYYPHPLRVMGDSTVTGSQKLYIRSGSYLHTRWVLLVAHSSKMIHMHIKIDSPDFYT